MSQIASIPSTSCLQARAGAFVLAPKQALALRPKTAGSIRITCGSAWVTINDGVDYFLAAEQQMTAPAGSRVVMESMRPGGPLKFDWQPAAAAELSPLAQALRDLRGATDLAARGLSGLGAAFGLGLAAGFKALARTAHSSASRAQGRMAS
jgi:hypothetical protein